MFVKIKLLGLAQLVCTLSLSSGITLDHRGCVEMWNVEEQEQAGT